MTGVQTCALPICQPLEVPVWKASPDVLSSSSEVFAQTGVLRHPTKDSLVVCIARVPSQFVLVKDGHVGSHEALILVVDNVEHAQVQVDTKARLTEGRGRVPHREERLVREGEGRGSMQQTQNKTGHAQAQKHSRVYTSPTCKEGGK